MVKVKTYYFIAAIRDNSCSCSSNLAFNKGNTFSVAAEEC